MVAGSSSKFSGPSEVDISGEGRGSKRLITDTRDNVLTSSANAVLSNDDLLMEILQLYMPSHFYSLNPYPNNGYLIPSKISTVFTFSSNAPAKILQSCNGLLLCYISPDKFFVYNPCANLFKMLPRPQIYVQPHIISVGIRLVFDPTKSPHFKVVHAGLKTDCDGYHDVGYHDNGDSSYIQIETYSSKIGSWSVCVNRFDLKRFNGFELGIYSNGALHWLTFANGRYWHAKLDILVDHPVLTTIQLSVTLDGELFCDPKFFESRCCLLLVCKDDPDSR
ncbi:hypothetical protein Tco_1083954 [Tanacetum coccineum]